MVGAVIIALAGIFIAYYLYIKRPDLPVRFVRPSRGVFRDGEQQVLRG